MAQDRPAIPAQLKRQLLVESGHRCAIPTCRTPTPLEFEHIIEWSISKEHSFENMIVLCANCHIRKGSKTGQIDQKSLKVYKANLGLINGRYNDFEKRVIEYFATAVKNNVKDLSRIGMELPTGMDFFVKYLVDDGLLYIACSSGMIAGDHSTMKTWALTQAGVRFIQDYYQANYLI